MLYDSKYFVMSTLFTFRPHQAEVCSPCQRRKMFMLLGLRNEDARRDSRPAKWRMIFRRRLRRPERTTVKARVAVCSGVQIGISASHEKRCIRIIVPRVEECEPRFNTRKIN